MRDQTINSSPNVSNSSPQVEPLIVGNANGIIRFLGTLSVLLVGLAFWAGMEIGHLKNRVPDLRLKTSWQSQVFLRRKLRLFLLSTVKSIAEIEPVMILACTQLPILRN